MLRSEVEEKAGLTRKAIEYYEERGFIKPKKLENGYRDYSEEDLRILAEISMLRKIGLSIAEIEDFLSSGTNTLPTVLRKRQYQIEVENRKKSILEKMVKGETMDIINKELELIEKEETIYEKLLRAFPGYFGQMLFMSYQPFLMEALKKDGEEAYKEFVRFLDKLPSFQLSDEDRAFVEEVSKSFDLKTLREVNEQKMVAIENPEKWWTENEDAVKQYEELKKRKEFQESQVMRVKERLSEYMKENRYYEVAIPLMRKFSRSYDRYYQKMMEADEKLRERMEELRE